jgi:predicted GIY-YIG superfamily endonuclease
MSRRNRFLDLMEQQTAALERLCTMQHVMMQHIQQVLMLQGVMPENLILADTFTHPLYHAFEEMDVASIPACPEGKDAGHVYLLIAENGWCKIGMSRKVTVRMKQHRIQLPFRTKLVHTIPTDNVVWAEDHLHKVFEDCRLVARKEIRRLEYRGKFLKSADSVIVPLGRDWFRLSTEAVVWIKTIQHMKKPIADKYGRLQWNVPVIPPPDLE